MNNLLFDKPKFGIVLIPAEFVTKELLISLYNHFIPIRISHDLIQHQMVLYGYSDLFEAVPPNNQYPTYIVQGKDSMIDKGGKELEGEKLLYSLEQGENIPITTIFDNFIKLPWTYNYIIF